MIEEHQVSKTTSQKRKKEKKTLKQKHLQACYHKKKKNIYKHDLLGC